MLTGRSGNTRVRGSSRGHTLYRLDFHTMPISIPKYTQKLLNACFSSKGQSQEILRRLETELDSEYGSELIDRISYSIIRLILENK